MNEKILKFIVFMLIATLGVYFTYPDEISSDQALSYLESYNTTLILTIGGITIGIVLGFILAFLKFINIKILSFIIDEYIDIIRGTPVLIQLMVFSFVVFATWSNNIYAAIIALGLNSSAYVAEIVRSGINGVDNGQMEAARAMGLDYKTSMKEIIFPQAIKNILPALANEFISLFKETSVVGMIGIFDLTMNAQSLQATLFTAKPILFAAVIYYISVKIFSFLAKMLETRLNKND
ncbi:His/Glu/Gln/Arg/opine amino acid ABC transporter permease [Campylobacter sputorum subsp. bubulus]|uniref:His/Glu/Gln/Arg/opine amino acid ABC transporter permease n=1 Tax=Campylobacter sputorum subsp. sputorum TaxID=32024 RepID=A0A381DLG4_9BACT|nr:amino acid ABC transporter permease [Campylobacter sputorum]ASM34868.1 amino acid ABC transporter, permease protein [Campylobacter sputorum aubsp. sputorum RM3237]ASM36531.1 amino acid ABC transporter, permease protein [Campylobacter sputorum bv. faecalis CCUG 20703]ASM38230.1 amino acid ABC transporter, permease protein [Campylobacter sputorum bv. paraureolyticus LMG 11764]MDY6120075.1 amino acid ABC transporter permease [Campylobacter sputorum]QEL05059.1 amino acid ABC transporter, permea